MYLFSVLARLNVYLHGMKHFISTSFTVAILSLATACSAASPTVDKAAVAQTSASAVGSHIATTPLHVVELFTSQGCSSCPPANKFVGEVADEDGVLALTYGVTYWDYLGWEDTFGDPKFTQRQREYRRPLKAQNIYTPQIILNGSTHSSRYTQADVKSVSLTDEAPQSEIVLKDGLLIVRSNADAAKTLAIVTYQPGQQTVAVKRGENGGRDLTLTNVVTDMSELAWSGDYVKTEIKPKPGLAYAALLHDSGARIISAATYVMPTSVHSGSDEAPAP